MSHGSGVSVTEANLAEFTAAQADTNSLFLKYQIQNESFKLVASGSLSGSKAGDFEQLQNALSDNKPAYLIVRCFHIPDKWFLLYFMPESSSVRDRMIYSSSVDAFKKGMGSSNFVSQQWNVLEKSECTVKHYEEAIAGANDLTKHVHSMTFEEKQRHKSDLESAKMMSDVRSKTIVDLPLKASQAAIDAFTAFGKEQQVNTLILKLDGETEELQPHQDPSNVDSFDKIKDLLPQDEPRFVFYRLQHQHEEKQATAVLFIYVCPQNIKPRLKMFYSTTKSVVLKLAEKFGITETKNFETSDIKEYTTETILLELYPQQQEKKLITKASKPGRGPARLHGNVKFSADK